MADLSRLPGPNADFWDWQMDAVCRGMDSDYFYHPDNERGPARENRIQRAKAICASCPVISTCREAAIKAREPYGIWGGMSEDELQAEYRRLDRLQRRVKHA